MEGGEGKFKHDCALNSWKNQGSNPNTDASGVCQGSPGEPRGRSLQQNAEGSSDLEARLSLLGQNLFRDASGHSPKKAHAERPQPCFFVNLPHQMPRTSGKKETHTRERDPTVASGQQVLERESLLLGWLSWVGRHACQTRVLWDPLGSNGETQGNG